ncbi:hypothetical protein L226DRAFT_576754 [Lentinus tigrinus ALCF2SS1-7]|uniref:Uncharacterized protein n=1 Tax=Lentinus tigrinus ALCF2SS1-6 TaxID=1328759 RepID=A0A5C2RNG3_9APHY|nr:hypothetical protein L227DRAFT_617613 [Lentinus tigrinus ALCF2SS1-6]RPD68016.1 hypothetical protein L226DRAFT_576754 [Lentinus tigrinus ALCF2SS1-7]
MAPHGQTQHLPSSPSTRPCLFYQKEVYLLRGPGQPYDFDNQEIWADDLSDLVIETGDHQMVIGMQPQYEDDEEDWLLGILLNDEEDDEAED